MQEKSKRPAAQQPPLALCRPHPPGVWEAAGPEPARDHVGRGSRTLIGGAGCRSQEGGVGEEMQGEGDGGCHRWASSPGAGPSGAGRGRFK